MTVRIGVVTFPGSLDDVDARRAIRVAGAEPVALWHGSHDLQGVDALVLFNRFYQPDFDLEDLEVSPQLNLSTPYEIRLPLLWIAVLYGRVKCSLGATRGVHSATEIIKYVMAGADVAMTTSALLQNGIDHLRVMLRDLEQWMEAHEYESIRQMRGCMSQQHVADPAAFERANYIKTLESYKSVLRDAT